MKEQVCENTKTIVKESSETIAVMEFEVGRMKFLNRLFMSAGIGLIGLLAFWTFEKDPLIVEDTGTNPEFYVCIDGVFEFERYVKTDKPLTVRVEPRLTDLKTKSTYVLESKYYDGHKQDGIVSYRHKIKASYPSGVYEYQPYLIYDVNPIKTISKPAPPQTVIFGCNLKYNYVNEIVEIAEDPAIQKEAKIDFILDVMENGK
jgi:hypothetical protein